MSVAALLAERLCTEQKNQYRARARGARSREVRENHLNGPTTIEAVQQRSNNIITRFVGGVVK